MEPQHIYTEVGRYIKRYRKRAHRTQQQLAAEVGMSRASLANIEAGRQQVLLHYLYAISEALDLESPTMLMPLPLALTSHDGVLAELPLPKDGLSDKQQQDVRQVMVNVLFSNTATESRGAGDERQKEEDFGGNREAST